MEITKTEYLAFMSNFDTHATAFIINECEGKPGSNYAYVMNPDSFFVARDGSYYLMTWHCLPLWRRIVSMAESYGDWEFNSVRLIGLSGTCTIEYMTYDGTVQFVIGRDCGEALKAFDATVDAADMIDHKCNITKSGVQNG